MLPQCLSWVAVPCLAVQPCHAVSCHAVACHAVPCHAMQCHFMPHHPTPLHATLRHTTPRHTTPHHTAPYPTRQQYAMLHHILPYQSQGGNAGYPFSALGDSSLAQVFADRFVELAIKGTADQRRGSLKAVQVVQRCRRCRRCRRFRRSRRSSTDGGVMSPNV